MDFSFQLLLNYCIFMHREEFELYICLLLDASFTPTLVIFYINI